MILLRSIIVTVALPGTVTVLLPYYITQAGSGGTVPRGLPGLAGMALILGGATVLLKCIWDLAALGRGTLAPIDPPRYLVVAGLYCYVRNPLYLGVLSILVGEAILFRSTGLLLYAAIWLVSVHAVIVTHEEPALRSRFGEQYREYCANVRRWRPGKPYRHLS